MGRWAQGRRRGGGGTRGVLPPPPPAPTLFEEGGAIAALPGGEEDFGGHMLLESSLTGSEPWQLERSFPWADPTEFGLASEFSGLHLRCLHEGGGVVYAGLSAPSGIIHIL